MTRKCLSLLIAFICVAGAAGLFCMNSVHGMSWFGKEEIKEPMDYFQYSCGGGMLGGHESLEVRRGAEGYAFVVDYKQDWHHGIPKVSEYKVSDKVLVELQEIFNDKEMASWQKKPKSDIHVLDGDTSSFSFEFGKRYVHFNEEQKLPDKWWDGPKAMLNLVKQYCAQGEKMPGLVVAPLKEEKVYVPDDGKLSLSMYYYSNNYLSFHVNNGTKQNQVVNRSYSITKLSPEQKEIASEVTESVMQLPPNYADESGIRLQERLEAGTYRLKFGDSSVEFEVK